jgi:hypothetical protein
MVFVEGNRLLLDQAVAGITSSVGGFSIGGGTSTPAPRLFLDRYSTLSPGDDTSSSFQTVLPSHVGSTIQVVGCSHHVRPPVRHGSRSSRPDPVGVGFASSARASSGYGRQGIVPYTPVPPYVHPPQPSQGVPYDYGGFFRQAPPDSRVYAQQGQRQHGAPTHHGVPPSAHKPYLGRGGVTLLRDRWVLRDVMPLRGMFPCLSTVVVLSPRDMGGIPARLHLLPRASVMRARRPPFFASGGSPFLLTGFHPVWYSILLYC